MRNERLATFLAESGMSLAAFGAKIGTGASAVHRYLHGRRIPSAETKIAISEASGGAVPVESWKPAVLARAFGENFTDGASQI